MKRLVRTRTAPKIPTLTFDIEVDVEYTQVAADTLVSHPISISKKKKLKDVYVSILNEVSMSVLNTVVKNGFKIVRQGQSKKSYTFYLEYYPTNNENVVYTSFAVIFRISDHDLTYDELDMIQSGNVVIKSFNLGKYKFKNYERVFPVVEDICNALKQGDTSVLTKYGTEL